MDLLTGFKFQVLRYFVPLSQGDEEQRSGGGMFPRSQFHAPRSFLHTPSAIRAPSPSPDVRLGSLTLMRHKMTFSHFSKGFIRPNLGEESECGLLAVSEFQVSADIPPLK